MNDADFFPNSNMETKPAPNAPSGDRDAMLAQMFPSMRAPPPAPERPAAPEPTSKTPPPASDAQNAQDAAPRVEPDAPVPAEAQAVVLQTAGVEIKLAPGHAPAVPALEQLDGIASDLGLDSAATQRLLDLHTSTLERAAEAADAYVTQSWDRLVESWREQTRRDPEISGKENMAVARAALSRFPGFKNALRELGIASHPEVLRLLVRVGRMLPGSTPRPAAMQGDEKSYRSFFSSMYDDK